MDYVYCCFQVFHNFLNLGLSFNSVWANGMKIDLNYRYFVRQQLWKFQHNFIIISCASTYQSSPCCPCYNMGRPWARWVRFSMGGYGEVQEIFVQSCSNFHRYCRKNMCIPDKVRGEGSDYTFVTPNPNLCIFLHE